MLTAKDEIDTAWIKSVFFLTVSLAGAVAFAHGLRYRSGYLDAFLVLTSVYCLFTSTGFALVAVTRSKRSERTVQKLLELLPMQAFVINNAGRLQYVNSALQAFAGPLLPRFRGEEFFALVHPDDEISARRAFLEGVAQRVPFVVQFRHRQTEYGIRKFDARMQQIEEYSYSVGLWVVVLVEILADDVQNGDAIGLEYPSVSVRPVQGDDADAFMLLAVDQLMAIVINCQACLRFLSARPVNLPAAVKSISRVVRDARRIIGIAKENGLFRSISEDEQVTH